MVTHVGAPLSQLDFAVLWEFCGRDRLPFPLTFTSDAAYADDFAQQKRQAAHRLLQRQMDERFSWAVQTLLEPVVRVEVVGIDRTEGPGHETMIRIHAGIDHRAGAVAVQQPGRELTLGGDITLSLLRVGNAAGQVAASVPPVRAGQTDGISVSRVDVAPRDEFHQPMSWLNPVSGPRAAPGDHARTFFSRPVDRVIEFTIDSGPSYNGRKKNSGTIVKIIDFTGDGRYLIHEDARAIVAAPATADALAAELIRHIHPRLNHPVRR